MRRSSGALAVAGLVAIGAVGFLAVAVGSRGGELTLEPDWVRRLLDGGDPALQSVIAYLRLPRVIAAILAGAALGVAGLLLQGVTRNPLADPFLLGVSGGAGLAVVVLHAIPGLVDLLGWWTVPLAAFGGAEGATALVLFLARGPGGTRTTLGLVLSGVIVNALCAAVITFLMLGFDPLRLRITAVWLAGGVGWAEWPELAGAAVALAAAVVFTRSRAVRLNAFALGEEGAGLVGVDTRRTLTEAAWVASLLTGLAVALAGLVGYVGLLVPHLVRLLVGTDHRATLPLAALGGGLMLVIGDLAARTVLAPQEVPVGVLAAIVGTPALLVLIRRALRGGNP
jgi:iron complex transport system permease protein